MVSPADGEALGVVAAILLMSASGVIQFADESLNTMAQETGDDGYKSHFLTVVRHGNLSGSDTVTWSANEEEAGGNDIMQMTGTVAFADGQAAARLELRISGDTTPELDESVTVTLVKAAKGALGVASNVTATVVIEANDDPYGCFVIIGKFRPLKVEEADRFVKIIAQRLYGWYGTVDVGYTTLSPTEPYAQFGSSVHETPDRADYQDYEPASGSVRFKADQEYGFIYMAIEEDAYPEDEESIFFRLTSATLVQGAQDRPVYNSPRLGQLSQCFAQIIILPSDLDNGILQLSPVSLTVLEGGAVPQISVVRSRRTVGNVSVKLEAVDVEAKASEDYILQSNFVTLASGETSKLLPIVIIDDELPEPTSESFAVRLLPETTTGPVAVGSNRSVVITIAPSDEPATTTQPAAPLTTVTTMTTETTVPKVTTAPTVATSGSAIAGGVTGGLLTLVLCWALCIFFLGRRNPSPAGQRGAPSVETAAREEKEAAASRNTGTLDQEGQDTWT